MTIVSTFFEVAIDGPVAHIAMNRPDKANGMTPDFWSELPRIVRDLDEEPKLRALVISGNGRHFTGGMDLSTFNDVAKLTGGEPMRCATRSCGCRTRSTRLSSRACR